jgi:Ca2+/Na+ antiporter
VSTGVWIVLFLLGSVVSLGGSWVLVSRLERLGERAGMSEALLGMVAALAADAPEVTSAVVALGHGQAAVGAGVVVGSNVFNLAALLGLGALVARRIVLHRRVVLLSGAVAGWVALVCVLAAAVTGIGPRSGQGILTAAWYTGLTLVAPTFAYRDRGLMRLPGMVIIGGYAAFVTALVLSTLEGRVSVLTALVSALAVGAASSSVLLLSRPARQQARTRFAAPRSSC